MLSENIDIDNNYEKLSSLKHDDYIIIDICNIYYRKVSIGKFGICEIIDYEKIKNYNGKIFLKTCHKQWLLLENKKKFRIISENVLREMWLCKIISGDDLPENFNENGDDINEVNVIYGRCVDSMKFLDKIYRKYIYKHKFLENDIVAIKSVAGSGKTTTLLELAKIHAKKRILYIAFNKSLITEIRGKIREKGIKNLFPVTFDALMRDVYIFKKVETPDIFDLKPQTLPNIVSWFVNKPYKIKNYYVSNFVKFCNQVDYSDIKEYARKKLGSEKNLLTNMWNMALNDELTTFDTIRKMVEINHWCKGYIDTNYDMIFIDESQDFDNIMLKILLEDTVIPKVFVGDTKQAIYEWKGCINAFNKLPEHTLMLEFYSTFRVGNPACDLIRAKFNDCNMISNNNGETKLLTFGEESEIKEIEEILENNKYVYLFRSWKNLLQTAQNIKNIWIYNFDSQIEFIKRLHGKMQISRLSEEELNDFSDDLPKFLLKLSLRELEKLISDIESNIVSRELCVVEMYTIHSYKGLEHDIVRIYNDIDIKNEENLYYVALTRGRKYIIMDNILCEHRKDNDNRRQTIMSHFYLD
jgi:hypothetical protein